MKKAIFILSALFFLFSAAAVAVAAQALWINGYKYYPLYEVCREKGIKYSWDSVGRIAALEKNGTEARIRVGSDKMLISGGKLKDIGPSLYFYNGSVFIPASFAKRGIDRVFKPARAVGSNVSVKKSKGPASARRSIKRIVLDPGHGGKDSGAVGRYYRTKEKDVVLDVAKRLKSILTSHGIKVYLTRDRDVFVPLWKRAALANEKQADFFISIHANASRHRNARGFEVFYYSEPITKEDKALEAKENGVVKLENCEIDKYSKDTETIVRAMNLEENERESKGLAKNISSSVRKKIYIKNRGVKTARFHVLKKTYIPAILVEIGFISNRKEEAQLRSSSHRGKIAEGLANGILAYKEEYERTDGFSK